MSQPPVDVARAVVATDVVEVRDHDSFLARTVSPFSLSIAAQDGLTATEILHALHRAQRLATASQAALASLPAGASVADLQNALEEVLVESARLGLITTSGEKKTLKLTSEYRTALGPQAYEMERLVAVYNELEGPITGDLRARLEEMAEASQHILRQRGVAVLLGELSSMQREFERPPVGFAAAIREKIQKGMELGLFSVGADGRLQHTDLFRAVMGGQAEFAASMLPRYNSLETPLDVDGWRAVFEMNKQFGALLQRRGSELVLQQMEGLTQNIDVADLREQIKNGMRPGDLKATMGLVREASRETLRRYQGLGLVYKDPQLGWQPSGVLLRATAEQRAAIDELKIEWNTTLGPELDAMAGGDTVDPKAADDLLAKLAEVSEAWTDLLDVELEKLRDKPDFLK